MRKRLRETLFVEGGQLKSTTPPRHHKPKSERGPGPQLYQPTAGTFADWYRLAIIGKTKIFDTGHYLFYMNREFSTIDSMSHWFDVPTPWPKRARIGPDGLAGVAEQFGIDSDELVGRYTVWVQDGMDPRFTRPPFVLEIAGKRIGEE